MSRRSFLKFGVASGTGAGAGAVAKVLPGGVQTLDEIGARDLKPESWIPSACGSCPAACSIELRRVEGQIVGVAPGEAKPCLKAYAIPQEIVHPDRPPAALRRMAARGEGRWERTETAQAITALAEILSAPGGPVAIVVPESRAISFAALKTLFATLGAQFISTYEWPDYQGPVDALAEATGWSDWRFDVERADGVISFGWDWLQAFGSPPEAQELWNRIRERHLPMVFVGPRLCLTAMRSREFVAARPGTEPLVALGLARLLIESGFGDPQAAAAVHYLLPRFDPPSFERITGVPVERLRELAAGFRGHRMLCLGSRKSRLADQRPLVLLQALLGQIDQPGGVSAVPKIQLPIEFGETNVDAIRASTIVLIGVNPAFDSSEPGRWKAALASAKKVVSISVVMDETAELADWVLPLALPAERRETYLDIRDGKLQPRTIDAAVASSRVDPARLAFDLAERLKPARFSWRSVDDFARALGVRSPAPHPASWDRAMEPWTEPPWTSGDYRLLFDTPIGLARGHGARLPYLLTTAGPHLREPWTTWVEINPALAGRLDIHDREWVEIGGSSGRAVRARARLFEGIPEDALSLPVGLGHIEGKFGQKEGGNPMELVSFRRDPDTLLPLLFEKVSIRKG